MDDRLAKMCKGRGWSQEQLSKKLGVSRQTLISVEKGHFNPSLLLAFRLADVFDSTIEGHIQALKTHIMSETSIGKDGELNLLL